MTEDRHLLDRYWVTAWLRGMASSLLFASSSPGRLPTHAARQPRLLRRTRCLVGMAQRQLRLAEERQPGLSRHSAFGGALQQPGAQFALQPADLLAQGRLHHVQVERRPAHGAELDDADEVAELAQFHGGAMVAQRVI